MMVEYSPDLLSKQVCSMCNMMSPGEWAVFYCVSQMELHMHAASMF